MTKNEITTIEVDRLRMWGNARTTIDQGALAELARSMQDSGGALQPPVGYRVTGDAGVEVELLMGERRWRAARMLRDQGAAEFAEIPVIVIPEPSEGQKYKWSFSENAQREDLRPSEAGAWLARMLGLVDGESGLPLWSQCALAEELGKDGAWVSRALALTRAPAAVQKAADAGEVSLEVAAMVGSMPPEMREGAAAEMVTGATGAMSSAAAREWVRTRYRRDLRRAEFDPEEVGLGGRPACSRCEWWGGTRDDVGGTSRTSVCLNPGCFAAKQQASLAGALAGVSEDGASERGSRHEAPGSAGEASEVFLDPGTAAGIWDPHSGGVDGASGWVDLSDRPAPNLLEDGGRPGVVVPSWGTLLEDSGVRRWAALDPMGSVRRLADAGEALRAAAETRWAGIFRPSALSAHLSPEERAAERAATAAGHAAAESELEEGLGVLWDGLKGTNERARLASTALAVAIESGLKDADARLVGAAMGCCTPSVERLMEEVGSLTLDEIEALLLVALVARRLRYGGFGELVAEEGSPLAELCCLAGEFDAGAWARKGRRRQAQAERDARDRAAAERVEEAERALARR